MPFTCPKASKAQQKASDGSRPSRSRGLSRWLWWEGGAADALSKWRSNGVEQGSANFVGLTIGPEERIQVAPGMHAAFDCQVKQQGLRFAQGKRKADRLLYRFLVTAIVVDRLVHI